MDNTTQHIDHLHRTKTLQENLQSLSIRLRQLADRCCSLKKKKKILFLLLLLFSFLSFFFRPCPLSFSDRAIALTSDPLFQGDVVLQTTDRPPHRNMTVCPHNVYREEAGSRTGYPCLHFYGGTFSQRCFTSTELSLIHISEPTRPP